MAEIWNLSALCRCCHADGNFRSMAHGLGVKTESFADILRNTFSLNILPPTVERASYTICDTCIVGLLEAAQFKLRLIKCEAKFAEYCRNEVFSLKIEDLSHGDDVFQNQYVAIKQELQDDEVKDETENEKREIKNLKSKVEKETTLKVECGTTDDDHDNSEYVDENTVAEVSEIVETELIRKRPASKVTRQHARVKKEKPNLDKKNLRNVEKLVKNKKQAPKNSSKRLRTKKREQISGDNLKEIDESLIIKHLTDNGTIYSCKSCSDTFKDLASMKQHLKEHTVKKMIYKCKQCQRQYSTKAYYEDHLERHRELRAGPFFCDFCSKSFKQKNCLAVHVDVHKTSLDFKCHLCGRDFKHKSTLRRHVRMHNGIYNGGICDVCGRAFNNKTNMLNHKRVVHDKIKPFVCDICDKMFTYRKHLNAHKESHNSERGRLQCDRCPKSYLYKDALRYHLKYHPGTDGVKRLKTYKCGICEIEFGTLRLKFEHMTTLHLDKVNTCPICGKCYTSKYVLNRHITTHAPVKNFTCEKCDKKFHTACRLKRHLNVHDPLKDEALKRCDLCKKHVRDMDKHYRSHFNRDLCCQHCGKAYSARSALNRHIQSFHLGIKPILCTLCVKRKYLKPQSVQRHMLRKHNVVWKKETEGGISENVPNNS